MNNGRNADLHNHTTGSDGKQSPMMFLLRAQNRGKKKISITDHSSIEGYRQLEEQVKYFAQKALDNKNIVAAKRILKVLDGADLIPGIEIITSYKGVIIEVLGYEIDIDLLDKLLQEKSEGLRPLDEVLYENFTRIIDETGIAFDRSVLENADDLVKAFYKELLSHEENKRLFKSEESIDTLKKFYFNYLYDFESPFFIDLSETRPKVKDVIDVIHQAGGRASLAHPGRYKSLDMQKEIDRMIGLGLDAIEVYYPDHSEEFRKFLLGKVREYGLDVTGGSDDHRNPKEGKQYKMGTEDIPQMLESNWIEKAEGFANRSKTISDFRERLKVMVDSSAIEEKAQKPSCERNITTEEMEI